MKLIPGNPDERGYTAGMIDDKLYLLNTCARVSRWAHLLLYDSTRYAVTGISGGVSLVVVRLLMNHQSSAAFVE